MEQISPAERVFQDVYNRLSIEHDNIITREVFHQAAYQDIVKLLMKLGVPDTDKDGKGLTPADLLQVER